MCVSFHLSRLEYVPIHALQICNLPCDDPFQQAIEQSMPPCTSPPPNPNTLIFGDSKLAKREDHLTLPYAINNAVGALSRKTALYEQSSCHSTSKLIVYIQMNQICQWVVGVQHPQHIWNNDVLCDSRSLAGPSSWETYSRHHSLDLCRCWCTCWEVIGR